MSHLAEFAAALDKKRVSIDQCFLSTIVNGDPKSAKLGAALDAAHACGKIICPIHFDETLVESSFLPEATRLKLFALQNRLSDGYSFYSFDQNLRHHTLAMIRPEVLFPALRKASLPVKAGLDFVAIAKSHKAGKGDYVDRVNRMPYPPASYKPGMKADEIFESISAERSFSMWRILEALKSTGTLDTGREEWEYTVAIGTYLADMGIGPQGLDVLIHKVRHHEWRSMPDLWAHTRINAQIELGYIGGVKKPSANDLFDLTRIAVALNDADVLLCDTAMSEMIRQSKVQDILSDVKVFSMKQRDEAAEFIATLVAHKK
jgi:hypothetical protein